MARFKTEQDLYDYRDYVTTSLQFAPQQKWISKSYAELTGRIKTDERNGDEIAEDVIVKAGLVFEEK